ncbi:polymorphic toxin type 44 domain-containing protein [Pseudomonas knackmussii]|uniref:polymorphic toxin type 44 domain-containing protein n=1 Tax=Pseudomonas knackmussii TaxID=65741 RepID=UPI0009FBAB2A|nr:polymorphic toxin type 44 domain-containing protein [Pseudomonas knackmussii]
MAIMPRMPANGMSILSRNLHEARRDRVPRGMALPQTYYWFYQKVRNGGEWDYKQQDSSLADFGNFNYGATGYVAGIPENILLMGAGFAQGRAGTSKPGWGNWYGEPPYGDDPDDQTWIKHGIEYAKQYDY